MKIEEKFNVRAATPVTVQMPSTHVGFNHSNEGVKLVFDRIPEDPERSRIAMHLTPRECLRLAHLLQCAAMSAMDSDPHNYRGRAG